MEIRANFARLLKNPVLGKFKYQKRINFILKKKV